MLCAAVKASSQISAIASLMIVLPYCAAVATFVFHDELPGLLDLPPCSVELVFEHSELPKECASTCIWYVRRSTADFRSFEAVVAFMRKIEQLTKLFKLGRSGIIT